MAATIKSPLKLGVTGGIGSGKTSVCRVFRVLGIPVFAADEVAKEILDNDMSIRLAITTIAGKDIYSSGRLNRAELADLIFRDKSLLERVNSIVHPAVFAAFREWTTRQASPYVIMEAAILIESGASKLVDRIATVVAPIQERIDRVKRRNNLTYEQVCDRISNQIGDDERMKHSNYVIRNSENDMIIPAILDIHNDLMNYIKTEIDG